MMDTIFISLLPDDYTMLRMAKNLKALQYITNINNGRQNIASFISPAKRTIKSIDRSIDREDREHQILEFL